MVRRLMALAVGTALLVSVGGMARAANNNGSGGDMPAYYDGELFTINFKLLHPDLHKLESAANQMLDWVHSPNRGRSPSPVYGAGLLNRPRRC